jgi:phosphinothricin acetyltransferase
MDGRVTPGQGGESVGFALRDVTPADAAAIAAIYRHHVETSVATFEETPPDAGEIAARIAATLGAGFPWLVADEAGRVLAYAYAGPYHKRSAYRFTVENSVYVAHDQQRRGIARALMQEIIARCTRLGYRQMMARISDEGSSPAFHAALGFKPAGRTPAVGLKFGRWVDVIEMQLPLGEGSSSIP